VRSLEISTPHAQSTDVIVTDDVFKREVQAQWDQDACGSHYVQDAAEGTLEWYREAERYRYTTYAPWMPSVMEFAQHHGESVLEIGAGLGTDLAQFATHGAATTDLDLSSGHLEHAQRNFALRGLSGEFRQGDAEHLPFDDATFDVVYSNGVIHHTPNAARVVHEIHRVLKPGGKAIVMVYAENSWHYWREQVLRLGLQQRQLETHSMAWIMSGSVEISSHGQRPLVKVYTRPRLRKLFAGAGFRSIRITQRQMVAGELPRALAWIPLSIAGRLMGWNLIVKSLR